MNWFGWYVGTGMNILTIEMDRKFTHIGPDLLYRLRSLRQSIGKCYATAAGRDLPYY